MNCYISYVLCTVRNQICDSINLDISSKLVLVLRVPQTSNRIIRSFNYLIINPFVSVYHYLTDDLNFLGHQQELSRRSFPKNLPHYLFVSRLTTHPSMSLHFRFSERYGKLTGCVTGIPPRFELDYSFPLFGSRNPLKGRPNLTLTVVYSSLSMGSRPCVY